ncbi:O-antigen ligase-related protein [Acididesulfobacillus acetoxydans]|uniref:O-antigen ligase-related protein n=1 Tax=Acididesulfobacillus acetoxydans TaxID=1561005 RepID=A0A8S0Y1L6_9FIRM|nr:O-antigen ligase family protein [Acididesulfobacillus acetoxydans]CAA7599615.1 O-antigen ligase-related protein [Acididesulfobacillus acetoxydans]CEJ06474.1 Tetratricopeptide repeat [Acididesulfobacillus acetoxydans]
MAHWRLSSQSRQNLLWFNVVAALLLVGVGAWFRGLYFPQDFLVVNIVVGVLGLTALPVLPERTGLKFDLLDGAVLSFGLSYSLAVLAAVSTGDAIEQCLRVWTYVLYYFILSRSLEGRVRMRFLSQGLVLVGGVLAVWGIMTVPGWVSYSNSWNSVLSSTFQYHNAFAAFLVGIMVLAAYFWLESERFWAGSLYGAGLLLMGFALGGTQSRGGYLVFLAAVVGMFVIYPLGRKRMVWLAVLNMFAGFFLWGRFLRAVNGKSTLLSVLILVAGCLWAIALTLAKLRWGRISDRLPARTMKWAFGGVLALALVVGGWAFLRHGGDVLGTIRRINLHNHSVEERFTFYWDAWRMFLQRPWLGYGGGGWNAAYRGFQSYLYNSTETHSIAAQVMVEAGALGIAVFIALLVSLGRSVYRTWRALKGRQAGERTYLLALALSAAAIGAHALIDFDLSEGTVSLVLWSNIAALRAFSLQGERAGAKGGGALREHPPRDEGRSRKEIRAEKKKKDGRKESGKAGVPGRGKERLKAGENRVKQDGGNSLLGSVVLAVLLLAAAVTAVVPFAIRSAMGAADAAGQALGARNYSVALQQAERATHSFPFEAYPWSQAAEANMYLALSGSAQGSSKAAVSDIDRAISLAQDDPSLWRMKAGILVNSGHAAGAYAAAQHIIPLAPFLNSSYEAYGAVAMDYALTSLQEGKKEAAIAVCESVAGIPEKIKVKVDNLNPFFKRNWIVPQKLEATPTIRLQADEADLLLGDKQVASDLKALTSDKTVGPQARLWLAAVLISEGNSRAAEPMLQGLNPQQRTSVGDLAKQIGSLAKG